MTEKAAQGRLPLVVIVGRPNVGKSTLFNRLTSTRRSIVTDEPGITRDRIYGRSQWNGRPFEVVDTGGIVTEDKSGIPGEILRQAGKAIEAATVVVQVVDARMGPTPADLGLALLLRRAGKKPVIAANKVDGGQQEASAAQFYEMSDAVFPISSEHGRGVDELLDYVTENFEENEAPPEESEIRVAIIGRPNVGKSTLLNRLAGEERAIVNDQPGTTRDSVDTVVRFRGATLRILDTAGIRRKGKTKLAAEKLSVVMARKQVESADVALLVLDASMGVTTHDATIAGYAQESGCSVVVMMNKWDVALEEDRESKKRAKKGEPASEQRLLKSYEALVRSKLKALDYAPVLFVSALSGKRAGEVLPMIQRVAEARRKRISTGELNRWLATVDLERGSTPASREVKIFYVTQASVAPPTFVLFTNQTRPLHFSYRRFLENQFRKKFQFLGAPIRFMLRLKQKKSARAARRES
jgi:GTP-binding protein